MTVFLVINAGSSSLKFALFSPTEGEIGRGAISGMGHKPRYHFRPASGDRQEHLFDAPSLDMNTAIDFIFGWLEERGLLEGLAAIGHRIVHGGRRFDRPALLDAETLAYLKSLEPLAPLHQPYNLAIVDAAARRFPDVAQIGAFDTAFHANRPMLQKLYGLPRALIDEGIIAYGFHGLSFEAISARLKARFGPDAGGRVIVLHLGSGSSLCAMLAGQSVATTMGFSPLDGPVMATRCGAIDPGVLLHLMLRKGLSPQSVEEMLYRKSGLAGLSGLSGDMQELMTSQSPEAKEALDYFVLTVCRETAALAAAMGGVDRLVFTAGIGENSAAARAAIIAKLGWLGAELDAAANERGDDDIAAADSPLGLHIIATDEEKMVAEGMAKLLK